MSDIFNEAKKKAAKQAIEKEKKQITEPIEYEAAFLELLSYLEPFFNKLREIGFSNISTKFGPKINEPTNPIEDSNYTTYELEILMTYEKDNPQINYQFVISYIRHLNLHDRLNAFRRRKKFDLKNSSMSLFNPRDVVKALREQIIDILVEKENS